jgi:hypothetical protein
VICYRKSITELKRTKCLLYSNPLHRIQNFIQGLVFRESICYYWFCCHGPVHGLAWSPAFLWELGFQPAEFKAAKWGKIPYQQQSLSYVTTFVLNIQFFPTIIFWINPFLTLFLLWKMEAWKLSRLCGSDPSTCSNTVHLPTLSMGSC